MFREMLIIVNAVIWVFIISVLAKGDGDIKLKRALIALFGALLFRDIVTIIYNILYPVGMQEIHFAYFRMIVLIPCTVAMINFLFYLKGIRK